MRKLALNIWSGATSSTTSAEATSAASGFAGRRTTKAACKNAAITNERTADGDPPVISTNSHKSATPTTYRTHSGSRSNNSSACNAPAITPIFKPLMANRCIVPLCMNSACCSSLSSWVSPNIIARNKPARAGRFAAMPHPRMSLNVTAACAQNR